MALTPPMGYNTWNDIEQCEESDFRGAVARLREHGLIDAGYKYLVVDDGWIDTREDKIGRFPVLREGSSSWPSGMPSVAEYVHSVGAKFGIYTSRGLETCLGLPASLGFEEVDAQTFAAWGVDFVKNDACGDPSCEFNRRPCEEVCPGKPPHRCGPGKMCSNWTSALDCMRTQVVTYERMQRALNATGRRILHAVCGWMPWHAKVGRRMGHMWRVGADLLEWGHIYEASRIFEQLGDYHGPNGWNDPDMLIGSTTSKKGRVVTPLQARAQFSLWVVMGAPLMLGSSTFNEYDLETYLNRDAIAVNQDPLGLAGRVAWSNCPLYPRFVFPVAPDGGPDFFVDLSGTLDEDKQVSCGSFLAENCSMCLRRKELECAGDCLWERPEDCARKDCFESDSWYVPDMDGQDRTKESSIFSCQQRCASVNGCSHFTYFGDGGCHLQSGSAKLTSSRGVTVGPPSCQIHCVKDHPAGSGGSCVKNFLELGHRPSPWTRSRYTDNGSPLQRCQQAWTKMLHTGDVALAVINWDSSEVQFELPLQNLSLPWDGASSSLAADLWAHSKKNEQGTAKLTGGALALALRPDGGHVLLRLAGPPSSEAAIARARAAAQRRHHIATVDSNREAAEPLDGASSAGSGNAALLEAVAQSVAMKLRDELQRAGTAEKLQDQAQSVAALANDVKGLLEEVKQLRKHDSLAALQEEVRTLREEAKEREKQAAVVSLGAWGALVGVSALAALGYVAALAFRAVRTRESRRS